MSDIARWDLTTSRLHEHGQLTIIPDVMPSAEGGWVRYDDIAPLLACQKRGSSCAGFFLGFDNSEPPQLWVWRGEPGDETAEPWQRLQF